MRDFNGLVRKPLCPRQRAAWPAEKEAFRPPSLTASPNCGLISLSELETAFAEPRYLEVIRADEMTFVGKRASVFVAREELIYDLT